MIKKFLVFFTVTVTVFIAVIPANQSSGRGLINDTVKGVGNISKGVGNTVKHWVGLDKKDVTLMLKLTDSENSSDDSQAQYPVSADRSTASKFTPATYKILDDLYLQIEADLMELGRSIIAYNKPTAEEKLTKADRDHEGEISPILYSRVYAKGNTIVLGNAGKNKKFYPVWVITGEEGFPAANKNAHSMENYINGLHVGSGVNIIERNLEMPITQASSIQNLEGVLKVDNGGFNVAYVSYRDGKVTQLFYAVDEPVVSARAWKIAHTRAERLGLDYFDR